ncbi:hypothetical protein TcWFU_006821 [Taenia crassiceps]|uniref:Uncharacterized protein n=1 Tax=Taenia crassiceps TaxID=6207 RepID=A0ABR4Q498_9CEST
MPGKSTMGQHLAAAKFASLKGFLVSSDEDDYSEEEVDTSTHQKKMHTWLDDDDYDEEEEEEDDDEEEKKTREEFRKAEKSSAASKRTSSGGKRLQRQHRRRSEQTPSPPPPPSSRQIRSSKSRIRGSDRKVASKEMSTSSDIEEEAVNTNTEGEEEEQSKKEIKSQKRFTKQDSKLMPSTRVRIGEAGQKAPRSTSKRPEVAIKGGGTTFTSKDIADNSQTLRAPPLPTSVEERKVTGMAIAQLMS